MAQVRAKRTGLPRPSRTRARPPSVLRGNALATIDDRGRLKLPAGFRRILEDSYGRSLFLTSLRGDCMWIYPLQVWEDHERRLLELRTRPPTVTRFLERVAYYGSESEMDPQGRVLVPAVLRRSARMEGEVAVLGALNRMEVWNNSEFLERMQREPFTDADERALSELGI